jgi:hypothetical protein
VSFDWETLLGTVLWDSRGKKRGILKVVLVDFWLRKSEGNIPLDYLDTHGSITLKSSQRSTE